MGLFKRIKCVRSYSGQQYPGHMREPHHEAGPHQDDTTPEHGPVIKFFKVGKPTESRLTVPQAHKPQQVMTQVTKILKKRRSFPQLRSSGALARQNP